MTTLYIQITPASTGAVCDWQPVDTLTDGREVARTNTVSIHANHPEGISAARVIHCCQNALIAGGHAIDGWRVTWWGTR